MSDFRKLRVWVAARELAIETHRVTSGMRGSRTANQRDQLFRAASSVPTNIVEGNAHVSSRERARFFGYALCSVSEVEAHAQLSLDLRMIKQKDYDALLAHVVPVRMMLHGLLKSLDEGENGKDGTDKT
jgi:four helix bundle protein